MTFGSTTSGSADRVGQPNVLLIMTDQQRADHVGFGGNPTVQTPHLDSVAARGVKFDRAFVANPVCMPNRAAIMTGRMPSATGSVSNGIPLNPSESTFVGSLRADGYRTGLIGKGHLQNYGIELPPGTGFAALPGPRVAERAVGWDQWENSSRYDTEDVVVEDDFYGFDHVELAIGHGDGCSGHFRQWLREQGVDWRDHWPVGQGFGAATASSWYDTSLPEELYPTTFVAERGIAFVEAGQSDSRPWMLQLSFPDPHHPFTPPGRYADMYDPADIELPSSFHDDHERSIPVVKAAIAARGRDAAGPLWAPTEAQFRTMAARQYGMISMIDDGIGRVLAALERTGQLDNTVIIFTSDHGDMMGDHGLVLKIGVHYEAVTRVPLVIAAPGITPGTRDTMVQSTDISATIVDLCGTQSWASMHGRTLRPCLTDATVPVRSHVLIEDDGTLRDPFDNGVGVRTRTARTDEFRLTRTMGAPYGELYDLRNDPDEVENRFDDPSAARDRARAHECLVESMMQADESGPSRRLLA